MVLYYNTNNETKRGLNVLLIELRATIFQQQSKIIIRNYLLCQNITKCILIEYLRYVCNPVITIEQLGSLYFQALLLMVSKKFSKVTVYFYKTGLNIFLLIFLEERRALILTEVRSLIEIMKINFTELSE